MLKKIKILGTESSFFDRGQIKHKIEVDKVDAVYFNISLIRSINILKIQKKTVWKVRLIDGENLFTAPFKL